MVQEFRKFMGGNGRRNTFIYLRMDDNVEHSIRVVINYPSFNSLTISE